MVKYIVLKEGKRGYTLCSIHPKGHLGDARSNAIYTANKENTGVMICQVLERHVPNSGVLIRSGETKTKE